MTLPASGPGRLLLVAVLGPVAVTAAACASPGTSSPAPAHAPAPRTSYTTPARMARCATSALRIHIGASTATKDITNRNIDFTNAGTAHCFLQGYPAAAMVSTGTGTGHLIGSYARPYPATPAKPIVLASGQTAHAVLGTYQLGSHPATNCDPVTPHWLNGEGNADGEDHNRSWNCGTEGDTEDEDVLARRRLQQRNILATLMLSHGVTMLLAGDEIGRSQRGNNNAYCQDNELSWLDWEHADEQLRDFTTRLIALRRQHPVLGSDGAGSTAPR